MVQLGHNCASACVFAFWGIIRIGDLMKFREGQPRRAKGSRMSWYGQQVATVQYTTRGSTPRIYVKKKRVSSFILGKYGTPNSIPNLKKKSITVAVIPQSGNFKDGLFLRHESTSLLKTTNTQNILYEIYKNYVFKNVQQIIGIFLRVLRWRLPWVVFLPICWIR